MKHVPMKRCFFECVGHKASTKQFELAINAGQPRLLQLIGEHDTGFLVAPLYDTDHVETWCMHEESRAIVRRNIDNGNFIVQAYTYGYASLKEGFVSYTSPEYWKECPAHEEITPLMAGFIHELDFDKVFGADPGSGVTAEEDTSPDAQDR